MIKRLLFFSCFVLVVTSSSAQVDQLFPIYDEVHKLMDQEGNIVGELPGGYKIINTIDGTHSPGWRMGMPSLQIGECGEIVAWNRTKGDVSFFDSTGKRTRILPSILFSTVSPCYGGFYLAQTKKKNAYSSAKYVFLDRNGEIVFNQKGYHGATIFSEGLAAVKESGIGWTYINDLGHVQNILPDSLKKISEVGAFKSGLSRLQSNGEKVGFYVSKKIYFIDKEGKIKIDLAKLFPDKIVMQCSDFNDGIACIKFHKEMSQGYSGNEIAYINDDGKILAHHTDIEGYRPHGGGFISYMRVTGNKELPYTAHLISKSGKEIILPKKEGFIYHISNQFFLFSMKISDSVRKSIIFDAEKEQIVHECTGGKTMGAKGNLIAFQLSKSKRYYVVDLQSGNIVYDTDISELRVVGLDGFKGDLKEITNFVTSKEYELNRIPEMVNLKELTINGVTSKVMPDISALSSLKTLRVDNCRNIMKLPEGLNSIEQLSLRSCTAISNLEIALYSMPSIKKLYVINMDVTDSDKRRIMARTPGAYFSGSAKGADNELQEVIPGFE